VPREDIVAVRSRPAARTRVRVLPDGRETEETVEVEPDIAPLARRMMEIVKRDGRDLLMANLLLRARGVVHEARESVRELLDKRAREIVWGYVWKAGLAAAVNPLPVADLGVAFGIAGEDGAGPGAGVSAGRRPGGDRDDAGRAEAGGGDDGDGVAGGERDQELSRDGDAGGGGDAGADAGADGAVGGEDFHRVFPA
jgi:hypothetical protein